MIKETRINIRNYLQAIVSIAYAGHPDGREARLVMIERYAKAALEEIEKIEEKHHEDPSLRRSTLD